MRAALQRDGKRSKVSNVRHFFHGTVVDHVMRMWLDDPLLRHHDTVGLVTVAMDEMEGVEKDKGNFVRWRSASDRDEVRAFCAELITRLEPLLEEHVLPYPYEHGHWFKVPMKIQDQHGNPRDILLTGEMDLLVQQPQGAVVWDLKGTADDQYYRKVVAQLTFYDLAVYASTGKKTHFCGLIQPMCTERTLAWQITDIARRNLLGRVIRYAHDAWSNIRECTKDTATCYWCDVRHACPRYSTDAFGTLADGLRSAAGDPA